MKNLNEEAIILLILGEVGQKKLFNKIISEFKNEYIDKFSYNLDNVEKFVNSYYKTIINIAISNNKVLNYKLKVYGNKILKINTSEFYNNYQEEIETVRKYIKEFNDFQQELLREFNIEDSN